MNIVGPIGSGCSATVRRRPRRRIFERTGSDGSAFLTAAILGVIASASRCSSTGWLDRVTRRPPREIGDGFRARCEAPRHPADALACARLGRLVGYHGFMAPVGYEMRALVAGAVLVAVLVGAAGARRLPVPDAGQASGPRR